MSEMSSVNSIFGVAFNLAFLKLMQLLLEISLMLSIAERALP